MKAARCRSSCRCRGHVTSMPSCPTGTSGAARNTRWSGGLVFQPFTADYLRSWGAEWRKSSPFRLRHYLRESPLPGRRHLVMLSQVLPDPFNTGYRDFAFRIVDRVNGQSIASLRDLEAALESPRDGFHVVELLPDRGPSRIVAGQRGTRRGDAAHRRQVRPARGPGGSLNGAPGAEPDGIRFPELLSGRCPQLRPAEIVRCLPFMYPAPAIGPAVIPSPQIALSPAAATGRAAEAPGSPPHARVRPRRRRARG